MHREKGPTKSLIAACSIGLAVTLYKYRKAVRGAQVLLFTTFSSLENERSAFLLTDSFEQSWSYICTKFSSPCSVFLCHLCDPTTICAFVSSSFIRCPLFHYQTKIGGFLFYFLGSGCQYECRRQQGIFLPR